MFEAEPRPEGEPDRPRAPRRRSRTGSRILAPLSIIIVIVALVIIVASAHTGSGSTTTTSSLLTPSQLSSSPNTTSRSLRPHAGKRTTAGTTSTAADSASTTGSTTTGTGTATTGSYTVASGDTFAAISTKTGVPVSTLEKLNPGVSSSALTIGQVLKLK